MAAPADRVQITKSESTARGGQDADTDPYASAPLKPNEDAPEVQGVFFQRPSPSVVKDDQVYVTRDGSDNLVLGDAVTGEKTLADLVSPPGSGITEAQHEALDTLTHEIAESSFDEFTYGVGNRIDNVTTWTDSGMTVKVREVAITYTGNKVDETVTTQYDGAGVAIAGQIITEVFSYSGNLVDDVTRTQT